MLDAARGQRRVPFREGDRIFANREGLRNSYLMARALIRIALVVFRAHPEIAGRHTHHLWASVEIAKTLAGFQLELAGARAGLRLAFSRRLRLGAQPSRE